MKSITNKGSAAIEFVWMIPIITLFLWQFWNFFHLTTSKEFKLIASQQKILEEVRKQELSLPVLKQPCIGMHPYDWKELCR